MLVDLGRIAPQISSTFWVAEVLAALKRNGAALRFAAKASVSASFRNMLTRNKHADYEQT